MAVSIFARPVTRSKLSGEIENILLKGIIKGQLRIGEKLPPERELAKDLDVNRSTVRTALSKLESLDLIEIRHGDGLYVKDYLKSGNLELILAMIRLDEEQRDHIIATLLEFRTITGPDMAALAAKNRTVEHLGMLKEVIENRELSVLEKDVEVHHIIALASMNILYLVLLNFFNKFVYDYGHLYFNDPENQKRSLKFHQDIHAAVLAGDEKKARKVMADVLAFAEDEVAQELSIIKRPGRE